MTNTQLIELAKQTGMTINEVEKLLHTLEYRKQYNSRPEVREKRKIYTQERNAKMKTLSNLLREITQ